jgi:hypothetical protein
VTLKMQPTQLAADDADGLLVFSKAGLVAVLVRLSELHEQAAGQWFLEAAFGDLDRHKHAIFPDLGLGSPNGSRDRKGRSRLPYLNTAGTIRCSRDVLQPKGKTRPAPKRRQHRPASRHQQPVAAINSRGPVRIYRAS